MPEAKVAVLQLNETSYPKKTNKTIEKRDISDTFKRYIDVEVACWLGGFCAHQSVQLCHPSPSLDS
jgi:hypothetical protein